MYSSCTFPVFFFLPTASLLTNISKFLIGKKFSTEHFNLGESRGLGAFCQTAKYNRSIVRIKELQFERKKDISREVMKEMKLMRELRHDNVNR